MSENWVAFCDFHTPNNWNPNAVGSRCKSPRRAKRDSCVPYIQCVNSPKHLKCFRDDLRHRKPRRSPSKFHSSSLSPDRRRASPSKSVCQPDCHRKGTKRCQKICDRLQDCRERRDPGADSCSRDERQETMKLPQRCDLHVVDHMRDGCPACDDCFDKWRNAIKQKFNDLSASKQTGSMEARAATTTPRRYSPCLSRACPLSEEKRACLEYRIRTKTRSGSWDCCPTGKRKQRSPHVSWWFGGDGSNGCVDGGSSSPNAETDEQIDEFVDVPDVRKPCPKYETKSTFKSRQRRCNNKCDDIDHVSCGRDKRYDNYMTATTDLSKPKREGILSQRKMTNDGRLTREKSFESGARATGASPRDHHNQSTYLQRSRRLNFRVKQRILDKEGQNEAQKDNTPSNRYPKCIVYSSKIPCYLDKTNSSARRSSEKLSRNYGNYDNDDEDNDDIKGDRRSSVTYSDSVDTGTHAKDPKPTWGYTPSWSRRYPQCRPFCPSESILTSTTPNTKREWADRHASLMLECHGEKYATAKERTRRLVNKSRELKKSMSNMCLDFGDLEQRLEQVRKLQKRFVHRTTQAIEEIQWRHNGNPLRGNKGQAAEDDERGHDSVSSNSRHSDGHVHSSASTTSSLWNMYSSPREPTYYSDGDGYQHVSKKGLRL